jgi:SpoVK/Ycf46/Vps4 family AAA+-type ATPase
VAESVKLPLYYVGAAELGRDLLSTERKLEKILSLAKAWQAIVLIDEADVFLAQRDLHDMHRNGLVSIFLRVLEYHEGVVFLTTNRVEDFDPAIMSRVHLRVKYPELDATTRQRIWLAALQGAEGKDGKQPCSDKELETLAEKYHLNGREIANLARTVKAVAKSRGDPVSLKLVKELHDMNALEGTEHGRLYL